MRTRLLLVLVSLVMGTAGVLAVPGTTAAASQQKVKRTAVITFVKNHANPQRSTLVWQVFEVRDGKRTSTERRQWRAGSGFHRKATNACRKNVGWLPSGRYRPQLYADYPGNLIKGRAIRLGSKRCHDGTRRTDLFIHTEQGRGNSQCRNRRGDQACRWEYPAYNDYRSHGCVKLAPGAMRQLERSWRRWFSGGYDARVSVRVR